MKFKTALKTSAILVSVMSLPLLLFFDHPDKIVITLLFQIVAWLMFISGEIVKDSEYTTTHKEGNIDDVVKKIKEDLVKTLNELNL